MESRVTSQAGQRPLSQAQLADLREPEGADDATLMPLSSTQPAGPHDLQGSDDAARMPLSRAQLADLRELEGADDATRLLAFGATVGLVVQHGGRELLGSVTERAVDAYGASLIGHAFPSFWLEAPLAGEPGFDLHVYYDRPQLRPGERFAAGHGFGMQALFDWFFGVERGGVGVGFAHDLRGAARETGAYVNFGGHPLADPQGFFAAMGAPELLEPTTQLLARLPHAWHPWYFGLFPARTHAGARVGSFVTARRQASYARDPATLAADLAQAGLEARDSAMLERISELAALPYRLELQLDATPDGTGDTLGVDLVLRTPGTGSIHEAFAPGGGADRACTLLEDWGAADARWRSIERTAHSRLAPLSHDGREGALLSTSFPSFIKAKWKRTQMQEAKVYLHCEARLLERDPSEGARS